MNHDQCKYSEHDLNIDNFTRDKLRLYPFVECPECGAIRSVKSTTINGRYHHLYPIHNTLIGTARVRDDWWKQDKNSKQWAMVRKEEVK